MSKRKLQEAEIINNMNKDDDERTPTEFEKSGKKPKNESNNKTLMNNKKNNSSNKKKVTEEMKDALGDVPEKFANKQRTMVIASRGTTARFRHLMKDLNTMLPHSKKDAKLEPQDTLRSVNEICELRSCNNCVYFEVKRKVDCVMWISKTPNGPSAKFQLNNVHTMGELKMIGNCMKGSRALLSFDKAFDSAPHWQLIRELFTQAWGIPQGHPRSKPFIDHMFSFYILDKRIWFRHWQLTHDEVGKKKEELELVEIGPRFVLNPIKIFAGSFGGPVIYENRSFVTPAQARVAARKMAAAEHLKKWKNKKEKFEKKRKAQVLPEDPLEDVFH